MACRCVELPVRLRAGDLAGPSRLLAGAHPERRARRGRLPDRHGYGADARRPPRRLRPPPRLGAVHLRPDPAADPRRDGAGLVPPRHDRRPTGPRRRRLPGDDEGRDRRRLRPGAGGALSAGSALPADRHLPARRVELRRQQPASGRRRVGGDGDGPVDAAGTSGRAHPRLDARLWRLLHERQRRPPGDGQGRGLALRRRLRHPGRHRRRPQATSMSPTTRRRASSASSPRRHEPGPRPPEAGLARASRPGGDPGRGALVSWGGTSVLRVDIATGKVLDPHWITGLSNRARWPSTRPTGSISRTS